MSNTLDDFMLEQLHHRRDRRAHCNLAAHAAASGRSRHAHATSST
jgi:hypothetical protein